MRTLIIDDEYPARAALKGLLSTDPRIEIVGEADTLETAVQKLGEADYQLVFLDVHLRGGTGFDLVPHVKPEAKIIFATGSDQHAVRAFEVNALDYLVKPVRPDRLEAAISRILGDTTSPAVDDPPALETTDTVYLKTGNGGSRFTPLQDIGAIASNQNYSDVLLTDGTHHLVRRTMKTWEETLPQDHFVRVHRSTIVNLANYTGSDRQSYETSLLHIRGLENPVKASYRYMAELKDKLEAIGRTL